MFFAIKQKHYWRKTLTWHKCFLSRRYIYFVSILLKEVLSTALQFLLFSGECKIDLLSCAEREMRLEWEFSQEGWTDYDGSNFPFLPSWPTPICWQQIPFNGRQIHLLKISSWLDPGNKKKKQYLVFGNPSVIQSNFSLDGATVVCRISLNLSLKYEFVSKNQNGLLVVLIIFNFFSFTLSHSLSAYFPMLYLRKGFVLRIRVQTHSKSFFLHKDMQYASTLARFLCVLATHPRKGSPINVKQLSTS